MIYIFDEPSTGIHPRDVHRMTQLLQRLRDKGNTVLVVEHDKDVIAIADEVIDVGPLAAPPAGRLSLPGRPGRWWKQATPSRRSTCGNPCKEQNRNTPGHG